MEGLPRCILYEPDSSWAVRLRTMVRPAPASSAAAWLLEMRVASEVERLLDQQSQRLVLVALRGTMSARQCGARIGQAANWRHRWAACEVAFLLDEGLEAWHRACWEMGSGLVFVGSGSLPHVARSVQRFLEHVAPPEADRSAPDPLAWLPW